MMRLVWVLAAAFALIVLLVGILWIIDWNKNASLRAIETGKSNLMSWQRSKVISTGQGDVVGLVGELEGSQVHAFLGLRYGQAPVGDLRFQPPVAARPWEGTLEATHFPDMAMQAETPKFLGGANSPGMSEDSLFLNIFTPSTDGNHRPVLFWIHGGSSAGSANDHDGSALAQQGDVVVVTINYRLGVFGFLDLSRFGEAFAGSGANGIRDQILALNWVRDNIADYGGDAGNVTIFGESSGGRSALALMAAPMADGLYHKAIIHSAAAVNLPTTDYSERLAKHLSVEVEDLPEALRALSAEDLLAAQKAVQFNGGATIDGTVVTRSGNNAILDRGEAGVPLIVGSNRDEGTLFAHLIPWVFYGRISERIASETFAGADPGEYLAQLEVAYPDDTRDERFERIWTDRFRRSAVRTAERASGAGPGGWLYRFDLPLPEKIAGGDLGATHAAEIPFTFNSFATDAPDEAFWYDRNDSEVRKLAEDWSNTIITFARTGDPNGAGLPLWPRYTNQGRQSMILDREPKVEAFLDAHDREVWGDE